MSISNSTTSVNERTALECSILATLSYFHYFDFPLTPFEIWKYLLFSKGVISFHDVLRILEVSPYIRRVCDCKHGMYFLKGNESHIWKRHDRYIFAERKYGKALRAARIFARVPFVRMVAVVNTLALSVSHDDSDIDFLIVAKSGWIWLVRAITTLLMECMGKRPRKGHTRDAICLSFFLSDDSLSLKSIQLPEKDGIPDVYLSAWIASCVPLYSGDATYEFFCEANSWIHAMVPHAMTYAPNQRRNVILGKASVLAKNILEWIISRFFWLERVVQRLQLAILPNELREIMNKDTRVVLTRQMIKFHPNDRREKIRSALQKTYEATF